MATAGSERSRRTRMPRLRPVLLIAGIGLFLWLMLDHGVATILSGLAAVGLALVPIALFHFVPLALNTLGWRLLMAPASRPGGLRLLWMRWVGESMNNLLPVAHVGGDVVRARLLARTGVPGAQAGATVMVDFTLGIAAQLVFTAIGLVFLSIHAGHGEGPRGLLLGVLVAAVLLGAFYAAQRLGWLTIATRRLAGLVRHELGPTLVSGAEALDQGVRSLYARRAMVFRGAAARLCAWLLGVGETWLALYWLDAPLGVGEAVALESLGYAARSLAFAVPAAIGVQEGALVVIGAALGLSPAEALTLSLVKRVRELALGIPGLLGWMLSETRPAVP